MKPRKPLNLGDMVMVRDSNCKLDVYHEVLCVVNTRGDIRVPATSADRMPGDTAFICREQVYKVKRKFKKKATVFPAYSGKEDTMFYKDYLFRIREADFPRLTKKQRKLYGVPEGVK